MPNRMMSAAEFLDNEINSSFGDIPASRQRPDAKSAAERVERWTRADYMDFAERYGDYVAAYEKGLYRDGDEQSAVRELSI